MSPEKFISVRIGGDRPYLTGAEAQSIFNAWLQSHYQTGTTDLRFSSRALVDLMESAAIPEQPNDTCS